MRCPRCDGVILRSHGEESCLRCGHVSVDVELGRRLVEENVATRDRAQFVNAGRAWSDEERAFLAANKDRLTATEIGSQLGRTERAVHHYLSATGVRKRRVTRSGGRDKRNNAANRTLAYTGDQKRYRGDEVEEMAEAAGPGVVVELAARMGRTVNAVRIKASRSGISMRSDDGYCSAAEVAKLMGIPERTLRRWVTEGKVPATKHAPYWRIDVVEAAKALGLEVS